MYKNNPDGTTNKTKKVVEAIYSSNRYTQKLAIGNEMIAHNFKYTTLTAKGQTLISGRALVNMDKTIVGCAKKTLAHTHSFLDSSKQLPFGITVNNLLSSVLDEMWEEELASLKLKKKPKLTEVDGDKNSDTHTHKTTKRLDFLWVCCFLHVFLSPYHSTK